MTTLKPYKLVPGSAEAQACRILDTELPPMAMWRGLAENPAPGAAPE